MMITKGQIETLFTHNEEFRAKWLDTMEAEMNGGLVADIVRKLRPVDGKIPKIKHLRAMSESFTSDQWTLLGLTPMGSDGVMGLADSKKWVEANCG